MSSTESQPRLIAAKFAGQRGPQFTEWSKDYLDAATGKGDEDASWTDCFLGQDPQAGLSPGVCLLRKRVAVPNADGSPTHPSYNTSTMSHSRQ